MENYTDKDKECIKIVVPVYNTCTYLCRCIDSILAQTYKNFFLIIVDDGSVDGSSDICDEYANKDERIVVLHQNNKGLSNARNRGIEYPSNCQYITFIDSDDYVHKDYLYDLIFALHKTRSKVAIARHRSFSSNNCEENNETMLMECFDPESCYCLKDISVTPAWGKLYDIGLIEHLRFPENVIHEDYYFTWRVVFQTDKIVVVFKDLYFYFYNDRGIMHSEWNPKRMDVFPALDEKIEYFKKHSCIKALERAMHKKERLIEKYENKVRNTVYQDKYLNILIDMRNKLNVWKND